MCGRASVTKARDREDHSHRVYLHIMAAFNDGQLPNHNHDVLDGSMGPDKHLNCYDSTALNS